LDTKTQELNNKIQELKQLQENKIKEKDEKINELTNLNTKLSTKIKFYEKKNEIYLQIEEETKKKKAKQEQEQTDAPIEGNQVSEEEITSPDGMSKEDNLSPLKTAEDTKDTKTPVTERTSSFTLIKLQKKRQVLSNNSTDDTKVDGNFKQRRKAQTPPDNSSITRSGSVPLTTKTPGRKIISENKNKQSLSPPASKSLGKQKNPTAQKTPGKKNTTGSSIPKSSSTKHSTEATESKSRSKPQQTNARSSSREPRSPQPSHSSPTVRPPQLPQPTQTRPTLIDFGLKVGNTKNTSGIVILEVKPESLATKAGLQVGDIITAVNGASVSTLSQYNLITGRLKSGAAPIFKLNRGSMHLQALVKIPSQKKMIVLLMKRNSLYG